MNAVINVVIIVTCDKSAAELKHLTTQRVLESMSADLLKFAKLFGYQTPAMRGYHIPRIDTSVMLTRFKRDLDHYPIGRSPSE